MSLTITQYSMALELSSDDRNKIEKIDYTQIRKVMYANNIQAGDLYFGMGNYISFSCTTIEDGENFAEDIKRLLDQEMD